MNKYVAQIGTHRTGLGVYKVEIPKPSFGCSCFMVETKGVYILSSRPGALASISCTHVGAGTVEVYDAVCDAVGELPPGAKMLYKANPQTMCLWMFNAGLNYGLTVKALGSDPTIPVFMTLSWMEI